MIINDNSKANYGVGNEIIYHAEVLKSNLCDYNDAYILIRGDVTIIEHQVTQLAFKNCAPFTKCTRKIDETTIDDAENYSKTTGSLWFHSKDEANDFNADIANTNNFKSFLYKAKLLENSEVDGNNGILKNATIAVSLKYLSNFWRSLKTPFFNCKVELKLKWTKLCVLSAAGAYNTNANPNNIIFTIKDTKFYVPVVTLSPRDNKKLSKLLSKGFERSVYWN